jgi:hypothetical protein
MCATSPQHAAWRLSTCLRVVVPRLVSEMVTRSMTNGHASARDRHTPHAHPCQALVAADLFAAWSLPQTAQTTQTSGCPSVRERCSDRDLRWLAKVPATCGCAKMAMVNEVNEVSAPLVARDVPDSDV